MRTGWSLELKNAVDIAQRLEAAGVAAIAVHGRTRACRFLGSAEHHTVAEIKSRVSVPVFANGDIETAARARAIIEQTGVDGVMIGRAALGRPWLPGDIARYLAEGRFPERSTAEKLAVMLEHVQALHEFYGEPGIRIARKHVQWYLHHVSVDNGAGGVAGKEPGPEKPPSLIGKGFNQLHEAGAQVDFLRGICASMGGQLAA
jgi:tRNA-dihydrouridine synthase B